jgi:O-antigen/teichoic acid export membrane protein
MSLVKNSTIVVGGVVVSNLLAYAFHFIAGRWLGPEEYGEFGALMALFAMVALPAWALSWAVTKFTSRLYAENKLGEIAVMRKKMQNDVLIFSASVFLIIILCSPWIAVFLKIPSALPVIIVGSTLVFALLLPVNRGILQGMKKFRLLSVNTIIEAGVRLVLLALFLFIGQGIVGAILAYGLAYFAAFLAVFPSIKETKTGIVLSEVASIKLVYTFILKVLMANILIQFIINVPALVIKHFYTEEFTGYWTAAFNIARLSLFVTTAISMVMFPEIAGEKDVQNKRKIFNKAALLVLFASSGMALVFFIDPELLLRTLYGQSFLGAAPILEWMGFGMIVIGLLQLRVDYFLAELE